MEDSPHGVCGQPQTSHHPVTIEPVAPRAFLDDWVPDRKMPKADRSAVFLTHSSFTSPFRVGSHQLAKVLDSLGWRVLHLPTPVTPIHLGLQSFRPEYRARCAQLLAPRRVYQRTTELIPLAVLPWQLARYTGAAATTLYAAFQPTISTRVKTLGFATPDILFVDEPRLIGLARCFRPKALLYRATDLYHQMMGDNSVIVAERRALQTAQGFIATSQPVYDHLHSLAPEKPGLLVENGVDYEHFHTPAPEPADLAMIPSPRAVYVGAMDDRFDFRAIYELARARPDCSFILIGPRSHEQSWPEKPKNIFLLGAQPYEKIPGYLQHADIALLPLSSHPANAGRSPMKIYEYAAAGLSVVAAATPELARRDLRFVSLYDSIEALPACFSAALNERTQRRDSTLASAREMSWAGRWKLIEAFCGESITPPASLPPG